MKGMLTLVVTGGRDYHDRSLVRLTLDQMRVGCKRMLLVTGACPTGADEFARQWAFGLKDVEYEGVPADWDKYGRAAGPMRNRTMLEEHRPHFVVAFPGNRGTKSCINIAKELGLQVVLPAWDQSTKDKRLLLMYLPKSRVDRG